MSLTRSIRVGMYGAMQVAGQAIVTGTAATSLTVSGLDLASDGAYFIEFGVENGTATTGDLLLTFNGDATATNYYFFYSGAGTVGTRYNSNSVSHLPGSQCVSGTMSLQRDIQGRPRTDCTSVSGAAASVNQFRFVHIRNSTDNVTSLTITGPAASSLKVGSYIKVYKIGAPPSNGPNLSNCLHVNDTKANGVASGSSVAGANTRVLNTAVVNNIYGASLASNQITLPAGTYRIEASAPSFNSYRSRVYLYNVTDASIALAGQTVYAVGVNTGLNADVKGYVTIASAKVFELRHHIQNAQATNGLGVDGGLAGATELYAQLFAWKIG